LLVAIVQCKALRPQAGDLLRGLIRARLSAIANQMLPPNHKSKPWVRIAIVLGIWMALAVVFAGQAYLFLYSASQAEEDLPKHPPGLALNELFLTSLAECLTRPRYGPDPCWYR